MTASPPYLPGVANFSAIVAQVPILHPESHFARSIFGLSSALLWICLVIFLIISGLVGYASWKFRARPDEPDPKQVFGSTKWEMIYFIPPVILLAVIFVFTLHVMHTSDPPAHSDDDDVVVVGSSMVVGSSLSQARGCDSQRNPSTSGARCAVWLRVR